MNPDPRDVVAVVLGKAALVDKSTPKPDPHVLDAWAEIFADAGYVITVEAALRAVTEHYGEEHRSLMPADVVARARRFCRPDNTRRAAPLALPSRFESDADRADRIARGAAQVRDELARRRADKAARAAEEAEAQHTDQPDDATGDA